jgi:uncharacterized membrane protein
MNYKTLRMWQAIIGGLLGAIFAISIVIGNWIIPVIVMIIAISVMMILRRRVKEVVTDERTQTIAGKASRLTLQIIAIGMALAGAVLLAVSHDSSSVMGQVAITLVYVTCALLITNTLAYTYYNRKLGGK